MKKQAVFIVTAMWLLMGAGDPRARGVLSKATLEKMIREAKLEYRVHPTEDVFAVTLKSDVTEDGKRLIAIALSNGGAEVQVVSQVMPLPEELSVEFLARLLEWNGLARVGWFCIDRAEGMIYAQYTLSSKTLTANQLADAISSVATLADEGVPEIRSWLKPEGEKTQPADAPSAAPSAGAIPADLVGTWRVYSSRLFYDVGGAGTVDTTATQQLVLNADGTWVFGPSGGRWSVSAITPEDWQRWGVTYYGPKRKIVLHNWSKSDASGPIEESERVDFFWVIYRAEPPLVSRAGTVHMKFGRPRP